MNIEVGEYIRTKNGVIAQLEYIHDKDEVYWFDEVIYSRYGEEIDFLTTEELPKYVVSHSKNIIDLIEVGDYVNGYKVRGKTNEKVVVDYYCYSQELCDGYWVSMKEKDIYSIVTKQQFSNMEYRL